MMPACGGAVSKQAPAHRYLRLPDTALCAAFDGPLPDTRITSGKLAAHGRFVHLATKVLIRELLSTSSRRRMRRSCPCRQRPSLWRLASRADPAVHRLSYGIRRRKASQVPSSGDAHFCSSVGQTLHHQGPLFCHFLPIFFWRGTAGRVPFPTARFDVSSPPCSALQPPQCAGAAPAGRHPHAHAERCPRRCHMTCQSPPLPPSMYRLVTTPTPGQPTAAPTPLNNALASPN